MDNLFFGRKKELAFYRKKVFNPSPKEGYCCSISGANDVGKTTLVRKLAEEFEREPHPNVYYFDTTIKEAPGNMDFYWYFFLSLVRRFMRDIPVDALFNAPNQDIYYIENIERAYEFFSDPETINSVGTPMFLMDAGQYLDDIFYGFSKLGIHVIISIDEFDRLTEIIPEEGGDGSFFQELFHLSPKSSSKLSLSIVLISRKRVGTVQHHMAEGSDFESAFPPRALTGFDDEGMAEYFDSYRDLPCGIPEGRIKEQIIYYGGRHPGLLMEMRSRIADSGKTAEELDIHELFRRESEGITRIYGRMCTLLRSEYVSRKTGINCVGSIYQIFIGPAYSPNLSSYAEMLERLGFITRSEPGAADLYEMAGIPRENAEDGPAVWEPLSPHFIEYFRAWAPAEDLDERQRLLNETELEVRKILLEKMKEIEPESWQEKLEERLTPQKRAQFLPKLAATAEANRADKRNITYSALDVMGFIDYATIIRNYWNEMIPYFQSWNTIAAMEADCTELTGFRNTFAHQNSHILDEEHLARMTSLCRKVLKDIEDGRKGIVRQSDRDGGQKPPVPKPTTPGQPQTGPMPSIGIPIRMVNDMLRSEVEFVFQLKKQPNGNFVGTIKDPEGRTWPASIPKKKQGSWETAAGPGTVIPCQVSSFDNNAQKFILTPLSSLQSS